MAESARRGGCGPVAILLTVAVLVGGWSAYWGYAKSEVERALAAYQPGEPQGAAGWRAARVDGWPFRLRVHLDDARAALPDGVGLAAPRLVAQAYAYNPTRWYAEAPDGLVILRPVAGPVEVRGRVLRASATGLAGRPRYALEGRDLTFMPRAGADPFLLATAAALQAEFVQGPPGVDEAALLVRLEDGRSRPEGLLAYIGRGEPTDLRLDALITRYSRLSGATAAEAARRWEAAGGALRLRQVRLQAGASVAETQNGQLSLGEDGRLRGALAVSLRGGPLALAALAREAPVDDAAAGQAGTMARSQEAAGGASRLDVVFAGGVTSVGGFPIGPAPDLF